MELELLAPAHTDRIFIEDAVNDGFHEVARLLELARQQGHTTRITDSLGLPNEQRMDYVNQGWAWATRTHKRLKRTIGTGSLSSATYFGIEVPVLLVYERPDGQPVDIYPHDTKNDPATTIAAFLRDLTNDSPSPLLAARTAVRSSTSIRVE